MKHRWTYTEFVSFIRSVRLWRIAVPVLIVAALMIPVQLSDSYNRDRQTLVALGTVIVPEKFGYFGGLVHFDTLEIVPQGVRIHKHSVFRDKNLPVSYRQITKVVFGSFLGQRYIKLYFYEGWIKSTFRMYINTHDAKDSLRSLFDGTGIKTDNQWDIKQPTREDSIRMNLRPSHTREGYR